MSSSDDDTREAPEPPPDPTRLLDFWFADAAADPNAAAARVALWFEASERFDAHCRSGFAGWPDRALRGELASWRDEPRSALALVLALDQLPRNLFRGTARAFAYDARALAEATLAVDAAHDAELTPIEASFLYLPFEHAEDRTAQARSVALFEALAARAPAPLAETFAEFADYARRHRDVIDRFGRFPHRNAILGRTSTPEELAWLERASPF